MKSYTIMIYFQIWFIVVVYLPTPTTGQNPHGFSKFDTRSDMPYALTLVVHSQIFIYDFS